MLEEWSMPRSKMPEEGDEQDQVQSQGSTNHNRECFSTKLQLQAEKLHLMLLYTSTDCACLAKGLNSQHNGDLQTFRPCSMLSTWSMNGEPGMGSSAQVMCIWYSPCSTGLYCTSICLSLEASRVVSTLKPPRGPCTRIPSMPLPASVTSTIKSPLWPTVQEDSPWPNAITIDGLGGWRILNLNGDPAISTPSYIMRVV